MKAIVPAVALTALLLALPAQAQKSVNLQARTAGDLAELCAANVKEALGDAKINFCHGFAQGAITVELRRDGGNKTFCFPSSPPTRTATMNEFVSWVRANPDRKGVPAVDGLFRFLGERFPCR
ncbi:MAG: Rap1a/Tai family immunity protein [Acetobacteraceae bacterium]